MPLGKKNFFLGNNENINMIVETRELIQITVKLM